MPCVSSRDVRRESEEELSVTVAVDHLFAVPHGVVVVLAVVDGGDERHAAVVDGVAAEDLVEKVVRFAGVFERFPHLDVHAGFQRRQLTEHRPAGKKLVVEGVVDLALLGRTNDGFARRRERLLALLHDP